MVILDKLYKVISKSANICTIELADTNHQVFLAHFPNNPILPGFLIIDIYEELFERKVFKIKKAKFISSVAPQERISFVVQNRADSSKIVVENLEKKKIAEVLVECR